MPSPFTTSRSLALPVALFASALACGSSSMGGPPSAGSAVDAGALDAAPAPLVVDPNYPSPHAAIPPVDFNGGGVLSAMSLVTVTFDGDPLRDRVESFDDAITQSDWWTQVAPEYCAPRGAGAAWGPGPRAVTCTSRPRRPGATPTPTPTAGPPRSWPSCRRT